MNNKHWMKKSWFMHCGQCHVPIGFLHMKEITYLCESIIKTLHDRSHVPSSSVLHAFTFFASNELSMTSSQPLPTSTSSIVN